MAATMKDIARETGLGLATISSYMNGGNVRPKNREKIEAAIEKLNYEVNEVARGLKTNATKTIGVVIPELNSTFCSEIITEMEDIFRTRGYATFICDCRTDPEIEKEEMEFLLKRRVDGIVNMPVDTTGKNLSMFLEQQKPVVLIDREIQELAVDSVIVDNVQAAFEATNMLISRGYKEIGIIGGPSEVFTAEKRLIGYLMACEEAKASRKPSLIYHGDYTIESGVTGIKTLLQENPQMDAVFVTNYEMTMGTVIALNEMGKRIPEDIAIIGFDNLEFAKACRPGLTIVSQPTKEMGRRAAQIMLDRLSRKTGSLKNEKLETMIYHGESVGFRR